MNGSVHYLLQLVADFVGSVKPHWLVKGFQASIDNTVPNSDGKTLTVDNQAQKWRPVEQVSWAIYTTG